MMGQSKSKAQPVKLKVLQIPALDDMAPPDKQFVAPPRPDAGWKALLISDTHLARDDGFSYFSAEAGRVMLAALPTIIEREQVRQIMVLGDVFHYITGDVQEHKEFCKQTFVQLLAAAKGLPVHVIGGNHDRNVFNILRDLILTADPSKQQLNLYPSLFISLSDAAGKEHAYLTHDAGTSLWLHEHQVLPWLRGVRASVLKIAANDWVVTGHTHKKCDLIGECRTASIGAFTGCQSRGNPGLEYGVVEEQKEGGFRVMLKDAADLLAAKKAE